MQKIPKRTHAKDPKEDIMREHIKEPQRPPYIKIKRERGSITILYSTLVLMFSTYTSVWREFSYYDLYNYVGNLTL